MKIAVLDPTSGIAGDMFLGALIDVGLDRSWLEEATGLETAIPLPERPGAVAVEAVGPGGRVLGRSPTLILSGI